LIEVAAHLIRKFSRKHKEADIAMLEEDFLVHSFVELQDWAKGVQGYEIEQGGIVRAAEEFKPGLFMQDAEHDAALFIFEVGRVFEEVGEGNRIICHHHSPEKFKMLFCWGLPIIDKHY